MLLLQTWFSASFPTGAFSFSHGLETAIDDGRLYDTASCERWLMAILEHGSGWNDALLFAAAWHAMRDDDVSALIDANDLAIALCAGAERLHETTTQGAAFLAATRTWPDIDCEPLKRLGSCRRDIALPVASGASCAAITTSQATVSEPPALLPLSIAIGVATQSLLANLVWIAVRLVPLGQSDGLAIIARLSPAIQAVAKRAARGSLADIGSSALHADIASLQHEQMISRTCQS